MKRLGKIRHIHPENGWRRIASGWIDISFIFIPSIYTTLFLFHLSKSNLSIPPYIFGISLFSSPVFFACIAVYLFFYTFINWILKKSVGKSLVGLTVVNARTHTSPSRELLLQRDIIKDIVLFLLILLIPAVIPSIWLFLLQKLVNAISAAVPILMIAPSISSMIFQSSIPFLYFICFHYIMISLWEQRGIHDLTVGTKVIKSSHHYSVRGLLILSSLFFLAYALVVPFEKLLLAYLP